MNCTFNGQGYSEGALICSNGRELKCDSGEWRETGYACAEIGSSPNEYIRVSPNGSSIDTVTNSIVPCVQFIIGAPYNHVRLFNSCEKCKKVAIAWSDGAITYETVQSGQHKDILSRAQAGQMVAEGEC